MAWLRVRLVCGDGIPGDIEYLNDRYIKQMAYNSDHEYWTIWMDSAMGRRYKIDWVKEDAFNVFWDGGKVDEETSTGS